MAFQKFFLAAVFVILPFLLESAPPPLSSRSLLSLEGSGEFSPEVPNPFGGGIIERPFEKPFLRDGNFEEDELDMESTNPAHQPSEDKDTNSEDDDYVKPEISPEDDSEKRPIEETDYRDGGNGRDEDDKSDDTFDDSDDDEDSNEILPKKDDEEEDDDDIESTKLDDDDDEVPKDDEVPEDDDEEKTGDDEKTDFFHGGLFFDTPFFNVRKVTKYFQQLEKALGHVFSQTVDEALSMNGTYTNTTEEEVEIDGKKYIVQKSIIRGKDNDSSIYIEALSAVAKQNQTQISAVAKQNQTQEVKDSGT